MTHSYCRASLKYMQKKKIILGIIVIFILLGIIVPLSLPKGTEDLNGEERVFAEYALRIYDVNADHPLQRIFTLKKRIKHLEQVENGKFCTIITKDGQEEKLKNTYTAELQGLSFFGLTIFSEQVNCE